MPTTADRLRWPRVLRRLLKMDTAGGLPAWWQWMIPRYGRYGGPGWSSGRWCSHPDQTDWTVPPADDMDKAFMEHDRAYQAGQSWLNADIALVEKLRTVTATGLYGRLYRPAAMLLFSVHTGWLTLCGDRKLSFSVTEQRYPER